MSLLKKTKYFLFSGAVIIGFSFQGVFAQSSSTISILPTAILSGQSATITLESTNSTSCTLASWNPSLQYRSIDPNTTISTTTGPLTSDQTYAFSCNGSPGSPWTYSSVSVCGRPDETVVNGKCERTRSPKYDNTTAVNWNFGVSDINSLEYTVVVDNDPGKLADIYLQLYDGGIGSSGQYFGLQTNGKAIFSNHATSSLDNVDVPVGSTVDSNNNPQSNGEGFSFVTLWRDLGVGGSLVAGTYLVRVSRDNYDGVGDWFRYYVTPPGGSEQYVGGLRFLRSNPSIPVGFNDGAGTWIEFWDNNDPNIASGASLPYPLADLHVRILAKANGNIIPSKVTSFYSDNTYWNSTPSYDNADIYAEAPGGFINTTIGHNSTRIHPAGTLWTVPVLTQITPVPTSTYNTTPSYTFNTTVAGIISYGGSCSSSDTSATVGNNTITFSTLALGVYSNCTITVTDSIDHASNQLIIPSFAVVPLNSVGLTFNIKTGWNLVSFPQESSYLSGASPSGYKADIVNNLISLTNTTTLWAFDNTDAKWYFYNPSQTEAQGLAYTASHGYKYLDPVTLEANITKFSFWVNSKTDYSFSFLFDSNTTPQNNLIKSGDNVWNLISIGNTVPMPIVDFVNQSGKSISSIWEWNLASSTWSFWGSPSLLATKGMTLAEYDLSKGYDVLTEIKPGVGYWINVIGVADTISPSAGSVVTDTTPPIITIDPYILTATNQDITVTASTNEGSLNTLTHTFTTNDSFDFVATDLVGNVSTSTVTITNIDKVSPTATVAYNVTSETGGNVIATITPSKAVTVTNNNGLTAHTFTTNGTFTFNFTDAAGNTGTAVATVANIDKTAPVITLNGSQFIVMDINNPYSELGATVVDNYDTGLTPIIDSTSVNTSVAGTYIVTYNKTDTYGNAAIEVTRTVIVIDNVAPTATVAYDVTAPTSGNVIATITPSKAVTVTNNGGSLSHTFTTNGTFTFNFIDAASNTGTAVATVANIIIRLSTTTPLAIITNGAATTTLIVNSDTTNPTLDVSSFITGGTGTLPAISITSSNANNVTVAIPAFTVITSASTTWNGILNAPVVTAVTLPIESGQTKTLSTAIELGFIDSNLTFSKAVRLVLPSQVGKRVGYVRTGITFTEITNICSSDTQVAGDTLTSNSECKIDVGSDLVIWTKHFTTFATYTQTTNSVPVVSSGGGSSYSSGGSYFVTLPPTLITPTPQVNQNIISKPVSTNEKNLDLITTIRTLDLNSKGDDVLALQLFLQSEGSFPKDTVPNAFYGPTTKLSVKRFQSKYAYEILTPFGFRNPTGMVGEATRNKINTLIVEKNKSQVNIVTKNINTNTNKVPTTTETVNSSSLPSLFIAQNLSLHSDNEDVRTLQKYLNANGYIITNSGNGSPGKEVTYYGLATYNAVLKYQKDHGLPDSGYLGPKTRDYMQSQHTR